MTWAKFDDAFWTHPKTLAAGNEAVGAFVRLVCYGCNQLTDGFVPMKVARFVAGPAVLRRLVDVGLLEPQPTDQSTTQSDGQSTTQPTGYLIHDFLVYQPSRESVEKDREGIRARVAKHRENKAKHEARNGVTNALVTDDVTGAVTPAVTVPRPGPTPEEIPPCAPPSGEGAEPRPSASGASTPSAADTHGKAPRSLRSARKAPAPPEDTIPLPGTPARAIYDALTGDRALCPITAGPGDFAERIADPAAYPGVNVAAEVRRAGEYASANPGRYTDGRAFLRNWLKRKADEVARLPKPATAAQPVTTSPARKLFDADAYARERDEVCKREREALLERQRNQQRNLPQ